MLNRWRWCDGDGFDVESSHNPELGSTAPRPSTPIWWPMVAARAMSNTQQSTTQNGLVFISFFVVMFANVPTKIGY